MKNTSHNSEDVKLVLTIMQDECRSGASISPHLLSSDDELCHKAAAIFISNLLPEGSGLEELTQNLRVSRHDVCSLISMIGKDASGAFSFISDKNIADKKTDERISDQYVEAKLSIKEDLTIWGGVPRQLVAGVQPKIVVTKKGGELFFPGESLSTHILKFETDSDKGIVVNEFVTMTLARLVGIDVADVEIRRIGDHSALLISRFDRMLVDDSVRGVHVIDSCQALNLAPEYKYERNFGDGSDVKHIRDGVSLPMVFKLAKMADSVQEVVDWVLFNLIVGNWDSHGKNISFYYDSRDLRIAPFYDLVNIEAFGKYSSNLSMAIGDEFDGNEINAYQLAEMCVDCELHPELVASSLRRLSQRVSESLVNAVQSAGELSNEELEHMDSYVSILTQKVRKYLAESELIEELYDYAV